MVKLIDKPFNFLKWKYFPYISITIILVTTILSFIVTKIIWENYPYYFYQFEQNWILLSLSDIDNGWNISFMFFIIINFLIGLLSFFKNISLRVLILGLIVYKIYISLGELLFLFSLIFTHYFFIYQIMWIIKNLFFFSVIVWIILSFFLKYEKVNNLIPLFRNSYEKVNGENK